jgi:ABC-type nitrate/sulfonate/bicarbonate transport system substrate-binding protein
MRYPACIKNPGSLLTAAAMTLSLFLLTACGPSDNSAKPAASTPAAAPATTPTPTPASPVTITLFASPNTDSAPIWGAIAGDFYKAAGLDVQVKVFASGTTALQSFRSGQGDISMSGELPSVNYWGTNNEDYRVIAPMTRDTQGYVIQALSSVKSAKDLIGQTIATRVGSSGSWFVGEYLKKNNIKAEQVKLINLDTNMMPIALDKGSIAAFFIWQPFGLQSQALSGDKVHQLSTADGYMRGYTVLGARPAWLEKNKEAAIKFVAATEQGAIWAKAHPEQLADYLQKQYGTDRQQTLTVMKYIDLTMAFNQQFYTDFTSVSAFSKDSGAITQSMDWSKFLWTDGLAALGADHVSAPPAN